MRILIANDDGYLAPGIAALVQACQGLGEIDVIAPEQNASGTSNSLTLGRPLSVHEARGEPVQGFRYVNGTPSDSVHIALTGLLPHRPDLVVIHGDRVEAMAARLGIACHGHHDVSLHGPEQVLTQDGKPTDRMKGLEAIASAAMRLTICSSAALRSGRCR